MKTAHARAPHPWTFCPAHPVSRLAPLLTVMLLLNGCAVYHDLPLGPNEVSRELGVPDEEALQIKADRIQHPLLRPIKLDPHEGLGPDEAAVLAVLINPSLRATRDNRQMAQAQLLQAGILPNPQISGSTDYVIGGTIVPGLVTGYGLGVSWDLLALIQAGAKKAAARAEVQSVDLDVAWTEWQIAQDAKLEVYRVVSDQRQLARAHEVDQRLAKNLETIKDAVTAHVRTEVDLATAEVASQDAHAIVLGLSQNLSQHELALKKALGVPPDSSVHLRSNISLPAHIDTPSYATLIEGLEGRRLDLLALKQGYESQQDTVRAAILGQFPKITLGLAAASDTSNVHTLGPTATIDLPIFERGQGAIAIGTATRQKLHDEYVNRVFEARSNIALALANIRALEAQIAATESAVPDLQHLVDVFATAAGQGNVDLFSSYLAQNNLNQKTIEIIKLKQQLVETHIALELAAGRYLPFDPGETR